MYDKILRDELNRRQRENPRYSLRLLAREWGIAVSTLSEVMNGRHTPSASVARRIDAALAPLAAGGGNIESAPNPLSSHKRFEEQTFSMIADWYHLAILSLLTLPDFEERPQWIASRLGITPKKAAASLALLKELGCVRRNRRNRLVKAKPAFTTSDDVASAAIRESHRQTLALAKRSLARDSVDRRDITMMSIPADPRKLPHGKAMTRKFIVRLASYLGSGEPSEVYRINVNVFPVSRPARSPRKTTRSN